MSMLMAMLFWSSIRARAIINPIVVAAPAGEDSALYFVIRNSGPDDRLLEVTCACAERVEIHNMVERGGRRHMDTEPMLSLPQARLVEVRPGGSRHLMLLGLRRPLVAGETVEMSFRFASGTETRNVRVVADSRADWGPVVAETGRPRLMHMHFLAGSCWRGTFPDGRRTDTHCFTPIYGMFMQDRHVVEGGPTPYSGHTLYAWQVMARYTSYDYRASDGSVSAGRVEGTATGLSFPEQAHRAPDGSVTFTRSTWTRDGDDAYLVHAEIRRGERWRDFLRMRMVRVGPSPPG